MVGWLMWLVGWFVSWIYPKIHKHAKNSGVFKLEKMGNIQFIYVKLPKSAVLGSLAWKFREFYQVILEFLAKQASRIPYRNQPRPTFFVASCGCGRVASNLGVLLDQFAWWNGTIEGEIPPQKKNNYTFPSSLIPLSIKFDSSFHQVWFPENKWIIQWSLGSLVHISGDSHFRHPKSYKNACANLPVTQESDLKKMLQK